MVIRHGVWAMSAMGLMLATAVHVRGDISVEGANGSDGAFNPAANITINLADSPTAAWNGANPDPNPSQPQLTGVYDPDKWAVVFRYSSVNIATGRTVTFSKHPAGAPVVWLVSGTVTINGTLSLNGATGHSSAGPVIHALPGPGGFRGGRGNQSPTSPSSGGFGPGGTRNPMNETYPAGASFGSLGFSSFSGVADRGPTYSNEHILPLIGGSGGTGYHFPSNDPGAQGGGGAGGGAILIVAAQSITVAGTIQANGGSAGNGNTSGGSGGAIRLVADQVTGGGQLRAQSGAGGSGGGAGGEGRIRVEANTAGSISSVPTQSSQTVGATAVIWPPASAPTVAITMVHNQPAPSNPLASMDFPGQDVSLTNPNPFTVQLQCTNVPLNATVYVRAIPKSGTDCLPNTTTIAGIGNCVYQASFASGDANSSLWQVANVQLPDGFSVLQARVVLP